jgi:hypothetical protein
MQTMWSLYGMISLILLAGIVGYGAMIFVTNPHVKDITAVSSIKTALRNLGVEKPAWRTLIVSASQDLTIPQEAIWEAWSDLDHWGDWAPETHSSARWVGEGGWQVGARFEQVVKMGFPAGTRRSVETVEDVEPMRRVRWCNSGIGMRACHVWSFTVLPNGRTRVTNTEVYHGTLIGLIKPIVAGHWEKKFNAAVSGLAKAAKTV